VLAVNYFRGKHTYYEDVLSNNSTGFLDIHGNNADIVYHTFSLAYKYKIVDNAFMSLLPGVGAGIMTDTHTYPYTEDSKTYSKQLSSSDLVFPVSLDANFKTSKNWQVHPDYPVLALHGGLKLSYIIK
jgi:hypothetical protein